MVALYNEVPEMTNQNMGEGLSPWLLRLKLDSKKVVSRTLDMTLINKKLVDTFQD